jgi:tetratricopeptide (TPR) repeat protein
MENIQEVIDQGFKLHQCGNIEEAIVLYLKVIHEKRENAQLFFLLGTAYCQIGYLELAVEYLQQSIKINPAYTEAYNNCGLVCQKLKRYDDALKMYEQAMALKPEIDYLLGNLLHSKMHSCDWSNLNELTANIKKELNKQSRVISPFSLLALIDDLKLQQLSANIWVKHNFHQPQELQPLPPYKNHQKR